MYMWLLFLYGKVLMSAKKQQQQQQQQQQQKTDVDQFWEVKEADRFKLYYWFIFSKKFPKTFFDHYHGNVLRMLCVWCMVIMILPKKKLVVKVDQKFKTNQCLSTCTIFFQSNFNNKKLYTGWITQIKEWYK